MNELCKIPNRFEIPIFVIHKEISDTLFFSVRKSTSYKNICNSGILTYKETMPLVYFEKV